MISAKIDRKISFTQKPCSETFTSYITKKRAATTKNTTKFDKFLHNAFWEKPMESIRNSFKKYLVRKVSSRSKGLQINKQVA